jgi:mannose-1-phosphate guanylyltransferase
MLLPVVIAGGIGSRLWPVSRAQLPKQFIHFPQFGGSLFQNTLNRLDGVEDIVEPLVVCNSEHRFLVAEQLRALGKLESKILLEPVGKNTAPAVAMAALCAIQEDPDAVLLVLPADHVIKDCKSFHRAIGEAQKLAQKNKLITFGIVPGAPETGYGYIEKGSRLDDSNGFNVARFVEKPDAATAESYLQAGTYLWNSGMFMFSAQLFLEELKNYAKDIYEVCVEAHKGIEKDNDFVRIPESVFSTCRSDSIDYAVMEKTSNAAMIPLDAGWNDLGTWDALWEVENKNADGNAISGDVFLDQVSNSYIQAQSRLVAAVGIDDAVIIETADAVLVSSKQSAQSVKQIVEQLEASNRDESISHAKVFRPWGSYESLKNAEGYQVKHLIVKPGESLSLQMHHHRAEHWTVIKGEGVVTCDEKEISLKVNESTFIPLGSKHRLTNPFSKPVEIIEVQVGDYLGEDDIVRFDDKYGRIEKS